MSIIKHTSRAREINKSGSRNSIIYTGTYDEMTNIQEMNPVGTINEEIGRISSSRVYQAAAKWWECELVCDLVQEDAVSGPDVAYGKKSAQLRGSTMQIPLATHPDYLASWDHYLFAAPGVTAVPSFWEKTQFPLLEEGDSQKYAWGKTPMDAPETNGKRWRAIKAPTMPGVESRDVKVYILIISARYGTFLAACKMVEDELNRVRTDPGINTGIAGGNWKCDDIGVQWHEKYWLASLTWTKSGDNEGWNKILYGAAR